MKPGAVVMAAIVIVGGGVLLYHWRRNARIEAREDAADKELTELQEQRLDEIQIKPYWKEHQADSEDNLLDVDEALRLLDDLSNQDR